MTDAVPNAGVSTTRPSITVAIPHWRAQEFLPPCVRSVLRQTACNPITVVIYNDDELASDGEVRARLGSLLADPRVVLFTAGMTRGPYFAREVIRRASCDPWWATLDADDFVDPQWLERLIESSQEPGVVAAAPRVDTFVTRSMRERYKGVGVRAKSGDELNVAIYRGDPREGTTFAPGEPLSTKFAFRSYMLGLFDNAIVGSVGGFYGGHLILWDRLVTNLLKMVGKVVINYEAQYVRRLRAGSLTTSPQIAYGSSYYEEVLRTLEEAYHHCLEAWCDQQAGRITHAQMQATILEVATRGITARQEDELAANAHLLRRLIASSH